MADTRAFLRDPKIDAVLERAYSEWKSQRRQLVWRFLPLKDGMEAAVYTGTDA